MMLMIGLCSIGCQSMSNFQFSTLWEDHAPVGKPDQVSAFWIDGVDVKPDPTQGGMLIPGFAGRVIFMRSKSGDTVSVNSPITIQAYVNDPSQNRAVPMEQWTIQPEHLPLLFKRDIAGWGYTVWLPWNSYSPEIKQVRLIVVYQEKDQAAPLYSEAMTIRIQGQNARTPAAPTPLNTTTTQKVVGSRLQ
jgi:hypothetical protein